MPAITAVDSRIVNIISLISLTLGVLGSLFFAYDFLGRPGGLLRRFLHLTALILLGAVTFSILSAPLYFLLGFALHLIFPQAIFVGDSSVLQSAISGGIIGAFLGLLNGVYLTPSQRQEATGASAWRRGGVAFGLTAVFIGVNDISSLARLVHDQLALS
jgi:hypothetical protein